MIRGVELKDWRKRNGYTQEMLRMALGIGSRQTVISWEQSEEPLAPIVELALMALEHLPERCSVVAGHRASAVEQRQHRNRVKQLHREGVLES
jgi:DNA-binding XRE family transcriptional regulator